MGRKKGSKRRMFFAAMLLGLVIIAAGCGEKEEGRGDGENSSGTGTAQEGQTAKGEGGILLAQGEKLYIADHREWEFSVPDKYSLIKTNADSFGDKFYILAEYIAKTEDGEEQNQYFLNIFDGQSNELTSQPFDLELPEGYTVSSMEARSSQKLSFRLRNYNKGEEGDILVETDLEGNVTLQEDTFPGEEQYPWNPINTIEANKRVYDNTDGTTILSQWNLSEMTFKLFWYNQENKGRRIICELDCFPDALYLDQAQMLYYVSSSGLVRKNLESGDEELLSSIQELPYSNTSYMALMPGAAGELLFCSCEMNGEGVEVFTLTNEKPEVADNIRMAFLTEDYKGQATAIAVEYSLNHQDCPISREKGKEDFRNRILMELATGKGPELMWVSLDDMQVLAEKGILMDMRELIPEDLMEQIFPNVIEAGTVNGTMVALAPQFTVNGLVVSNQVWDKDSWSLSEFMDVVESKEEWKCMMAYPTFPLIPMGCLSKMIPNLEDTPFLDVEQRKAHFDHEDFARALELCKKYRDKGGDQRYDYYETWAMVKNGECVVECMDIYDGFPGFSKWMAQYSDSCHFTGMPGSGGATGWITVREGLLAVNAKAEHLEEIKEYIALLLDYENQLHMQSCNVRMDVTRECIVMVPTVRGIDETTGEPVQLYEPRMRIDDDHVLCIELKPDKTSYLEEYMNFLENAVVDRGWPEQLNVIMVEELMPYFSNAKTLEETVANIQNRVQLYLDE